MNYLINALIRFGVLAEDLDCRLIRAAMVIILMFFGYQKWFEYEAEVLIPYISNDPLISWMYPVFGIRGASWFWGFRNGCLVRSCSSDSGIKIGNSWGHRFKRYIHNDRHYYSIHAEWLGCLCRRVSSNGWQRSFPYEGCSSFCCISLFAEAGCSESVTFCRAEMARRHARKQRRRRSADQLGEIVMTEHEGFEMTEHEGGLWLNLVAEVGGVSSVMFDVTRRTRHGGGYRRCPAEVRIGRHGRSVAGRAARGR